MGIIENHLGYELDMLVYTFDKLLLVEHLVESSLQAGQVNALIEAFCIHARNLDEFFQGSGRGDTLMAETLAASEYTPLMSDRERKDLVRKINKQISHLTEQCTSEAEEMIGTADREAVLHPDR